ncbi:murein biosynthesis integral membrane protein MurJ [Patescibacteria group bacterium]
MIKKLLGKKTNTIAMAAVILGAASLVSRFIGLYRDRVLLGLFGASRALDIYYASFRIPDFVYYFLISGVISAGFIPVFISYLQKDSDESWYLANDVLNFIIFVLIIVCSLMVVFMPYLARLIAPGFELKSLVITIKMTRVMMLSPIFLGISALFSGILQSSRRFLVYSLAPIMYNLGIIFGALFLVKYFGLVGLAYGVVLGAFLHMSIQLPTAYLLGFRWKPIFDLRFGGFKRVLKLVGPRFLSVFCYQITFWVFTAFASLLAIGSIAVYNTAYNIFSFPLGVLALSFAVAAFPKLSESAQNNDKKEYVRTFSITFRQILFFILPASSMIIVLRLQIIQVAFKSGQFAWLDTLRIGQTLMFFCLGLFAEGLILLLIRGFLAWEDAWTPFILAFFTAVIRISFGWYFSKFLGVAGLALGFAIGSVFLIFMLFIFLHRKVGFLDGKNILISGFKILSLSLVSVGLSYFILNYLTNLMPEIDPLKMFLKGGITGIFGLSLYFLLSWIFKLEEFEGFKDRIFCRKLKT